MSVGSSFTPRDPADDYETLLLCHGRTRGGREGRKGDSLETKLNAELRGGAVCVCVCVCACVCVCVCVCVVCALEACPHKKFG